MSDQPNTGQTRELNLKTMAEQFMVGMQRHFDMLAFNLASRESVTEEAYNKHTRAPRTMPVAPAHRNFEQMQAYSRDLLFCQVVNDSLNLAVNCLNNVHLFLALVKARAEQGDLSPENQKKSQEIHREFVQAPLDKKFNRLEEDYGVMCELEDTITAFGFVIQCLVQQGGVVKAQQLDGQQELSLELKTVSEAASGDVWRDPKNFETQAKVFREGEKIEFSDTELQSVVLTVAVFAHQLFGSVFKYARDNQPGG